MWASNPPWKLKGATVAEAMTALVAQHPEVRRHLYTEEGKLRAFVNLYVNDEDIRYLQKEATAVKEGDNISIVPSIAGGAETHSVLVIPTAGCTRERRSFAATNSLSGMCPVLFVSVRSAILRISTEDFMATTITEIPATLEQGRNPALLAPPDHARGRHGGTAEAEGGARAVHWHGRVGVAAGVVSCGCGRGHAGPGGFRCGGLHQPAAADHSLDRRRGAEETGFRGGEADGDQSVPEYSEVRHAVEQRERAGTLPRLRHYRRRHR